MTVLIKDMTRRQAAEKLHGIEHPETIIQALEVLGVIKFENIKPRIDWAAPLKLETYEGTRRVLYLNLNMQNKRIVEIQGDPEYREVDNNGYITGYDAWLENT